MYNFSKIKLKGEFPYWFIRSGVSDTFEIFAQNADSRGRIRRTGIGRCPVNLISKADIEFDDNVKDVESIDYNEIITAFEDWKSCRPEATVERMRRFMRNCSSVVCYCNTTTRGGL